MRKNTLNLFIIRKAHGQVCTDYFLRLTLNDEEIKNSMYPVNIFMLFHETKLICLLQMILVPFYEGLIKTISRFRE